MIVSQKSLLLVSLAASSTLVAAGDDSARPRGVGPECEYFVELVDLLVMEGPTELYELQWVIVSI
jgi:hypothetical protein